MMPNQFGKDYFLIFRFQLLVLIIFTFATFGLLPKAVLANSNPWILLDATTGNVIAHHQARRPWHPASITKLMTAYTIFREIKSGNVDLNSPVRISSEALALPPSKMGLPVGTIMNIDNALKIILVKSANDVAAALAQSVGGSISNFAKLMNKSAKNLGMTGSHFSNPHGLHEGDQVTTARDMALLALAIQNEFPQYSHYFDISAIRFGKVRMKNHNALIYKFPGTNGMKTGYTCPSGLNIVARAQRDGRQLIVVILGGYSSLERNSFAAKLLQQGFDNKFHNPIIPVVAHVKNLRPKMNIYAVPANLRSMICKPSWTERQLNKKQRRKRRKSHLAKLKILRDTYLNETAKPGPTQKVVLGKATGLNPFKFKLKNGSKPQKIVGTPAWRPDRSAPPYAEFD